MSFICENPESLITLAIEKGDIDSNNDIALNPHKYECAFIVGASQGELYALFYDKNSTDIRNQLTESVNCIKAIRENPHDTESGVLLDIIESEIFDGYCKDYVFLIEIGGFTNPFDFRIADLPMFFNL